MILSNSSRFNSGEGIFMNSSGLIEGNVVESNTLLGVSIGSNVVYRNNLINANTGGTVSAGANNGGGNFCNGSSTCP